MSGICRRVFGLRLTVAVLATFGTQADRRVRDPRVVLTARAVVIPLSVSDTTIKKDESAYNAANGPRPLLGLTRFQRDVLFVIVRLDGTNPSGVRIKAELREAYGGEINHGRLYQNLRELVEEEFVEKRPVDGRTNAYRVSPSARKRLQAHAAWEQRCLLGENGSDTA